VTLVASKVKPQGLSY